MFIAHADGLYISEIVPVDGKTLENGIKGDTTYEKVAKLAPGMILTSERDISTFFVIYLIYISY